MRFLVVFLAALALANAAAVGESEEPGFLPKLTKWFSWDKVPFFGPIRTTPKPLKGESSESVESLESDVSVEEPVAFPPWNYGIEDIPHHEVSSAEAVHSLDELYQMDELKDILPPMDSLLNGEPLDEYDAAPMANIHDPHVAELIQNIVDYMHGNPQAESDSAQSESDSGSSEE